MPSRSISARFQGPPTRPDQAKLYQQAKNTMSLVKETKSVLLALDNVDGLDLDEAKNSVKVPWRPLEQKLGKKPDASLDFTSFDQVRGQVEQQRMSATIKGDKGKAELRFVQDKAYRCYELESKQTGRMTVLENKSNGVLTVEIEPPKARRLPREQALCSAADALPWYGKLAKMFLG